MDDFSFLLDLPPEKDLRAVSSSSVAAQEKFNILVEYVTEIRQESQACVYSYIRLGQIFCDIQDKNLNYFCLVGGMRYNDFFAFMYVVFGFRKSTVYNLMTIYKHFASSDCKIIEDYKGYSYSQLVELVPIIDDKQKMERVSPEMTVAEMREIKQLWKSDGFSVTAKDWKDELQTGRERHAQETVKQKREKRKQGIFNLLNAAKDDAPGSSASAATVTSEVVIKQTVVQDAGVQDEVKKLHFETQDDIYNFLSVENVNKWFLVADIPYLNLQYRRFIFANGDVVIAHLGKMYEAKDHNLTDCLHFFIMNQRSPVFNSAFPVTVHYVVQYLFKHKDEI